MTRARPQVLSLNGGEVDEEAIARSDMESYANKAAVYENALPAVKGGLFRAPGSEFIGATLAAGVGEDAFSIVRPWRFSRSQAFTLEFSQEQLRIVFGTGYVQTAGGDASFDEAGWVDDSTGGASSSDDPPDWSDGPGDPGSPNNPSSEPV